MMTVQQAFQLALQHHQAGRVADAEALYRQILAVQPNHAEALHFLGVIAHQAGRSDLAAEWIGQSVKVNPSNAIALANLGEVYRSLGRLDEAIMVLRQSLQWKPQQLDACLKLGNALAQRGGLDEAVSVLQDALRLHPNSAEAYGSLGIALAAQGRIDEAVVAYRNALHLWPDFPEALSNLGAALSERGQFDEAVAACRRALQQRPQFVQARTNLGNVLCEQGRLDEAVTELRGALQLCPNSALAHFNLGNALRRQGAVDEAIGAYRSALQFHPDDFETWSNLGSTLRDRGELDEALAAYRRALELRPGHSGVHSSLIYTLHFHPKYDDRSIAEEHLRWNRQFAEPWSRNVPSCRHERNGERRLRIGYVSPDFCSQAEAFFVVPLFEAHDHERFEIHGYASVARPDAVTDRLRRSVDFWHDVRRLSDEALAQRIRADEIDILVDLTMHMAGSRLPVFARKPAPIQVTWLAYPGSTGLKAIDYRITDRYLDPPAAELACFAEQAAPLPDCWCCYHPLMDEIGVSPLPATAARHITFGCLNHFHKVSEETLALFGRVLGAVEKSRLLLLAPLGSLRRRVLDLFARYGVASDRIEFVEKVPRSEYLELYHRIDIALDTLPYNGITTTCDALWMGVPVVSLVGRTAAGRAGLGLLSTLQLRDFACGSPDEFVAVARRITDDLPKLDELRAGLRARLQASPLMDAPRFARNMEVAYRTMWRDWCAKNPASS
jgi:predicted O-linked N-acetylglucosamine transferase (SPINDLY family)